MFSSWKGLDEQTRFSVKVISAVVVLILVFFLSVHYYKKSCAGSLLEDAGKSVHSLQRTINEADDVMSATKFLMTGDDETYPLSYCVSQSREEVYEIEKSVRPIVAMMDSGEYDEVRRILESPKSPIKRAAKQEQELRTKVIDYCHRKKNLRDQVVRNEWLLKARLKKPIDSGFVERPSELSGVPDDLFAMIPKKSKELESGLSGLEPCLNNSLGANLLSHRPILERINRRGKTAAVRTRASALYDGAVVAYKAVQGENDALSDFYRTEQDDGHYSTEDYERLLAAQQVPVGHIQHGDTSLLQLEHYLQELLTQRFVYVSGHSHESRSFRHTRTVMSIDIDGNSVSEEEVYHTDGYAYFYTLTTVTPQGKSSKTVEVGEIDSRWREWDYEHNEEIGWVREWKRLYEDNSTIASGKNLKPMIEVDPEEK